LGSALDCGSSVAITFNQGTFDTGGYAVNTGTFISQTNSTRTLNLNNSSVSAFLGFFLSGNNFTLNAGTSTVTVTSTGSLNVPLNLTYYNLTLANAGTVTFTGTNTFNTLTISGSASIVTFNNSNTINTLKSDSFGFTNFVFNANQTINKFEIAGVDPNSSASLRTFLRSNILGVQRSIAMTTNFSISDVDFRDIAVTGITQSGTRLGDCGGNSGITFDAPKTVYYANTVTGSWSEDAWVSTPGGSPNYTLFPLAQDTAVFQASTYPTSGATVTIDNNYNIGTIDMSARTSNTMTLAKNASYEPAVYGNWTNGSGTTITGGGNLIFAGRQTQTITTAGKTFPSNITLSGADNIIRIVGNMNISQNTFLNGRTLDLNGYTLVCSGFGSVNAPSTTNITFNGGTLQVSGSFEADGSLLTTTQGSGAGKIILTGSGIFFSGGSRTYNCTLESTGNLSITGSNTFTTLTNNSTIFFGAGSTTTVTNWNINGTGPFARVVLDSDDGISSFTLSKASGIVSSDYLDLYRSVATGGATWYAGANSINNGGNSGWIFTAPPAPPPSGTTGNFFLLF
jgi:hypothetical protein